MVAPFHLESLETAALEEAALVALATVALETVALNVAAIADESLANPIADPSQAPAVAVATMAPQAPHRHRGHFRRRMAIALSVVVLLVLAAVAVARVDAPAPIAAVMASMPSTFHVASAPVALPWAASGESAAAVPSIGIDVTSGPETSVPIASLTKLMTAYVILHDHPVGSSQNGPNIAMTQTDVNDFENDTVEDEANAQVALGEVLTERQLLQGLLVHSANNLADTLARWDAGSIPAFVAKMNHTAASLGMDQTHYADPSGFDESSKSTAGDLLKVAGADMENPTFAGIVQMPSVTLPVAGTISSYTPLLGFQGVIGVKSGFTTAAGGCDVVAVMRSVQGKPTLILSAVTGQTGPNVLATAGFVALNLADHVSTAIGTTSIVRAGQVVAHLSVGGHSVAAAAESSAEVLSWPGVKGDQVLVDGHAVAAGAKRGTRVGSVEVALGTQREVIPVMLRAPLPKPTLLQRLF
jgi:D-alanyl-D-alanine carboxypeptidase (penicillin-binding protein 5/6)